MRCPITLSVCLALIVDCLTAPEPSICARGDLSVACLSQGIFTSSTTQPTNIISNITQPVCECVPYYQCNNGTIVTDGYGIIDIRTAGPIESISGRPGAQQGPCDHLLEVCCMPPNILKPENKITPEPLFRRGCGQRKPEGVGSRLTGDKDNQAQPGEFRWMVAIIREQMISSNTEKLNVYQCGGALIHPRAIVTAAYCVKGKSPSQLKVRAGEWDMQARSEIFPHQDRDVEYVIVHEAFNSGSLINDIAILILKTPFNLTENVDLVFLPAHNETFDAARCLASGWGKVAFGRDGQYQPILKKIELPVVPRDVCQSYLRNTRLGKYFILNASFICAGGESGKDTCTGDGGSPLVCPLKTDPSRYVQAGIVSWGIGCGEYRYPAAYSNVALFRTWIDEQLLYHNLDITVYQPE